MENTEVHTIVRRINYADVQEDIRKQNSEDDLGPQRFNTSSYPSHRARDLRKPSELPYSFKRWLPLFIRTSPLQPSDIQIIVIPPCHVRVLLEFAKGCVDRKIKRTLVEKVKKDIFPHFAPLRFPPQGLFMRLDTCSATDGVRTNPGGALHTVGDVVTQLVTSRKALFKHTQSRADKLCYSGDPSMPEGQRSSFEVFNSGKEPLELFFLPFNNRMIPERQYRVFCPPAWRFTRWNPPITAISQYKWDKPWIFAHLDPLHSMHLTDWITRKCEEARRDILMQIDKNNKMDLSDTGSCLFEWIKDRAKLYGEGDNKKRELRVTC
ncbi:hypothetical protein F4805DRAFT_468150 [Annulohypoxylon moriforme]|nr:hypothetical protein F4805DRAFT_468150 [Annulohypoxylon moriforme]